MIDYQTYRQLKIAADEEHLRVGQLSHRFGISPKTVKKYLAAKSYPSRGRIHRASKLDPFKERIRKLLNKNEDYSASQIFRMMVDEGYDGGSSILRDYVAKIRPPKHTPYLTLRFAPGEAAQVDFGSCGGIPVGEEHRRLYVFVMTLCYSRMMYAKFILRQSMEHFLQCHRDAFEYFGSVPGKVMVDNCKVAVADASRYGDPVINPHFGDLASHYAFKVAPCGVRKPHEKGIVERGIGYLKNNLMTGFDPSGLLAANNALRHWLDTVANVRVHGTTRKSPLELFAEEKRHLYPLPLFPYDCCVISSVRVNSQYRVIFEANKYSVPPEFTGKRVELKVYPEKLVICYDSRIIAEHARCYERNKDFGNPEHDKPLLEQRRKARNGRILDRFFALGKQADIYYRGLSDKRLNANVHVRKIMALTEVYGDAAVKMAIDDGIEFKAFSSDYIANILEMRQRALPEPGPLHLTRKSDCLEIDFGQPNLDIYNL